MKRANRHPFSLTINFPPMSSKERLVSPNVFGGIVSKNTNRQSARSKESKPAGSILLPLGTPVKRRWTSVLGVSSPTS